MEFRANYNLADTFILVTDNASHFANTLMRQLTKVLKFTHNFSIAYSPWSNGTVEVVNSKILRHLKQLVSEYSLYEADWPRLINQIAYIINNRPMQSRNGMTPNKLFLGYDDKELLIQKDPRI